MAYCQLLFSPTGGTQRCAALLSAAWPGTAETVDLCSPDFRPGCFAPEDVVLVAVPSFGGRVPALAAQRLAGMRGNGAQCVLLCVYGNRAYEDTLAELYDLCLAGGFRVVAGVAAVAEHSIMHQYAAGRPDAADADRLRAFGEKIRQKLAEGDPAAPQLPGSRPYKKAGGGTLVPKATKACVNCGVCAAQCPAGAISPADAHVTDAGKCISCMRCTVVCPHKARALNPALVAAASLALKKACSVRKECELYL